MNYYNYFTEIEDEYIRRRGTHILISPLDWSLIETWREIGIPVSIVLRGINAAFDSYDRLARRGRKVNSLFYCQQEVEALYQQYRESRVGESSSEAEGATAGARLGDSRFAIETVVDYLGERCDILTKNAENQFATHAITETFARAAQRLVELVDELKARRVVPDEHLETALVRIEQLILEGLQSSLSQAEIKLMQQQAEKQLKNYRQGMGEEVYKLTLQNYLAKQWRERFKVPRLSLFYM